MWYKETQCSKKALCQVQVVPEHDKIFRAIKISHSVGLETPHDVLWKFGTRRFFETILHIVQSHNLSFECHGNILCHLTPILLLSQTCRRIRFLRQIWCMIAYSPHIFAKMASWPFKLVINWFYTFSDPPIHTMRTSLHLEPLIPRAVLGPTQERCRSGSRGWLILDQSSLLLLLLREQQRILMWGKIRSLRSCFRREADKI